MAQLPSIFFRISSCTQSSELTAHSSRPVACSLRLEAFILKVDLYKSQPINITIEDQFPMSTNKDIEIDKLTYDNAKIDDDTKKITWVNTLEARKENKLQMSYSVKYPKDKILQLD